MATITFEDGGGNQRTVPEWATEVTLNKLVQALSGKESKAEQEKTQKALKNLSDGLDDNAEDMKQVTDKLGRTAENIASSMVAFGGKVLDKVVGGALIILGTAVTVITAKINSLGNNLNLLSQSGLALEGGTIRQLASLNALGMSTDEAAEFMLDNAQAFRTMGNVVTNDVIKSFLDVTASGGTLGLTLSQATEFLGSELALRTKLFNLGSLDAQARARQTVGLRDLAMDQLEYSKALGVSTEAQRDFVEAVLGDNQMLMARTLSMTAEAESTLTTGVQSFLSGMRAMGGEAGGEIAAAVLEAATMGAVGFSDAAFEFITVLPSLADNMQDVIKDFNAGVIDGSEAAMSFTRELGNLSEGEKQRVYLLARAGDQQAKMMAKAITQFEQSAAKMAEQGLEIDAVQKGFNAFNSVLKTLKSTFSALLNVFMAGFGEGAEGLADQMQIMASTIRTNLDPVLRAFGAGMNQTGGMLENFGEKAGKTISEIVIKVIDFFKGFMQGVEEVGFGKAMANVGKALIDGVYNSINWFKVTLAIAAAFTAAIAAAAVGTLIKNAVVGLFVGGGAASAGTAAAGGAARAGGMAAMAAGLAAFANPAVAGGVAVVTLAIIALAGAFALASLGFEAFGVMMKNILEGMGTMIATASTLFENFGNMIESIFTGVGIVIEKIADGIANVIEKVGEFQVGKINAKADATAKTTQAAADAIQQLSGQDPQHLTALAGGISVLSTSLGDFAAQMSPTLMSSLKDGVRSLFGQDSPVEQVLALSDGADPQKIMQLAKATMATNAANSGATSLDPSLTTSSTTNNSTTNNSTTTNNSSEPLSSEKMSDLFDTLYAQNLEANNLQKKTNKLLSDISGKSS